MSLREASVEELAWAAGLFEGEGCVSSYTRKDSDPEKRVGARCSVAMKDADIIVRFGFIIGRGRIYPMRRPDGRADLVSWQSVGFEDTQATIAALWKWLGPRRRTRAREVLARANLPITCGTRDQRLTHCKRGHPFDEANTRIDRPNTARSQRTCRACAHLRYLAKRGD